MTDPEWLRMLKIILAADAELTRLRALAARAEDVEGIAKVIGKAALGEAFQVHTNDQELFYEHARAVSAWIREG